MEKVKASFEAAAPRRRYSGKFKTPKFRPARPKSWRPHFGYVKPRGQEQ